MLAYARVPMPSKGKIMAIHDITVPHAEGELTQGSNWSNLEQFVIFAADNDKGSILTYALRNHGIGFKQLDGSYKGERETSYIVNARNWERIRSFWLIEGQESILHLGPFLNGGREATLYYAEPVIASLDVRDEPIGTFRQTTKEYALKQDAWTFDPSEAAYFICE